jgi:hypothetical protein
MEIQRVFWRDSSAKTLEQSVALFLLSFAIRLPTDRAARN